MGGRMSDFERYNQKTHALTLGSRFDLGGALWCILAHYAPLLPNALKVEAHLSEGMGWWVRWVG